MTLFAAGLGRRLMQVDMVAGMIREGDCVAIFHSVQSVMKAEKQLLALDLDILLIPVPRSLSADCGMAIRFSLQSLAAVKAALSRITLPVAEIWVMQEGDFRPLDLKEAAL